MNRALVLLPALLLSALASVAPALAVAQTSQGENDKDEQEKCETEYRERRGTGYSCRTKKDLYKVKLRDGSTVLTHGPDNSAPPADPDVVATSLDTGGICTPTSDYRVELIYAVPQNKTDRFDTMKSEVQTQFANADIELNAEAGEFAHTAHYKVLCDQDGTLAVGHAVLPTASSSDSFGTIVSDLRAQGFNSSMVKYWVFYDDGVSGFTGQGTILYDDRLMPDNRSNVGPSYGINYGNTGAFGTHIAMHENAHTLGAVQISAPNSSGLWHCNDEEDTMCYADGGSKSNLVTICTDQEHYDCQHNDYFHPNPLQGNYLYDHWNVGSCLNRFLTNNFCEGGQSPTADAGADQVCMPLADCRVTGATASDLDSDLQSYQWRWVSCPAWGCPQWRAPFEGSLNGSSATVPDAVFTPGAGPWLYTLELVIADRKGHVATDAVVITVP